MLGQCIFPMLHSESQKRRHSGRCDGWINLFPQGDSGIKGVFEILRYVTLKPQHPFVELQQIRCAWI